MGTFEYPNGAKYRGAWNQSGQKEGYGELELSDGSKYKGQFRDGFFCGYGVVCHLDGSRYEGEFLNGKFNGYGIYTRLDGMTFEGQFKDGKPEGYGLITFPDGSHGIPRYEGLFENFILKAPAKSQYHVDCAKNSASKAKDLCSRSFL